MVKKCMVALVALLMAAGISGCSLLGPGAEPMSIAIVWGYHQNTPAPNYKVGAISDAITECASGYGTATIVMNDGAPYAMTVDVYGPEGQMEETQRISHNKNKIKDALKDIFPETSEVDTLAAITLAARSLSGAEGTKYLYVCDSGLSTTGYIDFTRDMLNSEVEDVLAYLKEECALPDLDGVEIVWIGMGDVAGEQEDLSPKDREKLEEIWRSVLEAAGASSVDMRDDPPGPVAEDYNSLPDVTPVEITPLDPFVAPRQPEQVHLRVYFKGDQTVFYDHDAAYDTLRSIADLLNEYPDYEILLVGTTANTGADSAKSCMALSMGRANEVRDVLVGEMGVSEDQIRGTMGLGFEHKFHVPDREDGILTEKARENRSVMILGVDTEDAQFILDEYNLT